MVSTFVANDFANFLEKYRPTKEELGILGCTNFSKFILFKVNAQMQFARRLHMFGVIVLQTPV